jgi:hypothetical protein
VTEQIPPLDPGVVSALRAEAPAPPGARERVRERLAAVIPGVGLATSAAVSRGLHGSSVRVLRASSFATSRVGTALTAFALGGGAGAALHAALVRPPAPQVVVVERRPADAAPSAKPAADSPPSPRAAPIDSALVERAPAAPPQPSTRPSASHRTGSRLSAERTLLDEARRALVEGDAARALARLDDHRRAFPSATLAEERDALRVEALVKAGQNDDARALAERFRTQWPDSLFLPTVDAAIGSIP